MSPSTSTVNEIKSWLAQQHVVVPTDWVEACVDFLSQEYNSLNFPVSRLKQLVYEQWLNADLLEFNIPTLPSNLSTLQKFVLTGCFSLQVNAIKDVGKPAYSQLKQLEGINDDVEVSAAPKAFLPHWETKPTRMLILNLTDGVTFVQGMEYKPITSLSPNLSPGVKIRISGPLDCRFGMLLLTGDHIKILGGEVEKFQQKYSRENILRDILQLQATNEPSGADIEDSLPGSQDDFRNRTSVGSQQWNCSLPSYEPPRPQPVARGAQNIENFESDDDDFVNNLDMGALDEIERVNSQVTQSSHDDDEINEDEDMLNEMYEFQKNAMNTDILDEELNRESLSNDSSTSKKSPEVSYKLLSSINQGKEVKEEFSITIHGYIINVLSRLECKSSKGWHLTAKISDDSASIDVDFHDKVLQDLVGMSAKDMMAMKLQAQNNADVKSKMMEAVSNFKKKLQQLNCLMEILFSPNSRPCVVKCKEYNTST